MERPSRPSSESYVIGARIPRTMGGWYVFSKPVNCSELSSPGWDMRMQKNAVPGDEIFGKTPGTFAAVTTVTPAPGEGQ